MLDRVEALRALAEAGTMAKAAVRLRLTASAVSKRISALEAESGLRLVEPDGRRVRVTSAGLALLADVEPLLIALRERITTGAAESRPVRIAASDSLLASWLPRELASARARVAGLALEVHAHRGPFALERVRAGELDLAIVPGGDDDPDLRAVRLRDEPLGIVTSGCWDPQPGDRIDVLTVEVASLTGRRLEARLARRAREWGFRLAPVQRIESFAAAVRLAEAGFGPALVPAALATAMGATVHPLPEPGIHRTIHAVARQRTWDRGEVVALVTALTT